MVEEMEKALEKMLSKKIRLMTFKEEQSVKERLISFISWYRDGRASDVYIPTTYSLFPFRDLYSFIANTESAADIYKRMEDMLKLLSIDRTPIILTPNTNAYVKCVEIARQTLNEEASALGFANRYLTVNRETFREILEHLDLFVYVRGASSALEAIAVSKFRAEGRRNYVKAFISCYRERAVRNEIHRIAALYESLLIFLGAASHMPLFLDDVEGTAGDTMLTLHATPLTDALRLVLTYPEMLSSYINAYRGSVRIVVDTFFERDLSFVDATNRVSRYLGNYKISVNTEERFVRAFTASIWSLLESLFPGVRR